MTWKYYRYEGVQILDALQNKHIYYLCGSIYILNNGVSKLIQFIAGLIAGGFISFIAFATFSMSDRFEETIQREKQEMDEI